MTFLKYVEVPDNMEKKIFNFEHSDTLNNHKLAVY